MTKPKSPMSLELLLEFNQAYLKLMVVKHLKFIFDKDKLNSSKKRKEKIMGLSMPD